MEDHFKHSLSWDAGYSVGFNDVLQECPQPGVLGAQCRNLRHDLLNPALLHVRACEGGELGLEFGALGADGVALIYDCAPVTLGFNTCSYCKLLILPKSMRFCLRRLQSFG